MLDKTSSLSQVRVTSEWVRSSSTDSGGGSHWGVGSEVNLLVGLELGLLVLDLEGQVTQLVLELGIFKAQALFFVSSAMVCGDQEQVRYRSGRDQAGR